MTKRFFSLWTAILLLLGFSLPVWAAGSTIPYGPADVDEVAVYLNGNFNGTSGEITGNVYTANGNITGGQYNLRVNGHLYHKTGTSYNYPGFPEKDKVIETSPYQEAFPALAALPTISNYVATAGNGAGSLTVSEDTHFGTLNLTSNAGGHDVTYDTTAGDLHVVVDTMDISRSITQHITGPNRLFLYVNSNTGTGTFALDNPGTPDRLYIIARGLLKRPSGSGSNINGYLLYTGVADIGANNIRLITGGFLTDAQAVTTDANDKITGLFYAPYAAVKMSSSTQVTGRLVADSLVMNNWGAHIQYSASYASLDLPEEILPTKYEINGDVQPGGSGTISPVYAEKEENEVVHFTATPAPGYAFSHFTTTDPSMTPDGSHNITVTGDVTITAHFTLIDPGAGYQNGILGEYYDTMTLDANSSALKVKRIDEAIAMNLGYDGTIHSSLSRENFSIRWSGYIKPTVSGNYTFRTYSDDGVRLTVNGQSLIDNWGFFTLAFETAASPIYLEAGNYYPIELEYQQGPLYAAAYLFWEAEDLPMSLVPPAAYFVEEAVYDAHTTPSYYNQLSGSGTGLTTAFYEMDAQETLAGAPAWETADKIHYNWGFGAPGDIETDKFYGLFEGWLEAKFTEQTTLVFTVDDGIRVWLDGDKIIDEWDWHSRESFTHPFAATAGQKYKLRIEYIEKGLAASLSMGWKGSALGSEIIPKAYLYEKDW